MNDTDHTRNRSLRRRSSPVRSPPCYRLWTIIPLLTSSSVSVVALAGSSRAVMGASRMSSFRFASSLSSRMGHQTAPKLSSSARCFISGRSRLFGWLHHGTKGDTAMTMSYREIRSPVTLSRFSNYGGLIAASPWKNSPGKFHSTARTENRMTLCMSDNDIDDESAEEEKTSSSTWNIAGLKKETLRLTLRCHKKIQKANARYTSAVERFEALDANLDATLEELESCPDVDAPRLELEALRERLGKLQGLEEGLQGIKGKVGVLPEDLALLVMDLDVADSPPVRVQRPKKKKGESGDIVGGRLPYRKYFAENGTEIRVGKQAEDNDELSMSPEHRDGSNWWMHASGCPGSHVVIRIDDENLNSDIVRDAAALAARQSKCSGANIKVSLTRCRNVTKPRGAKAGLVYLNGDVRTVTVNMKEAEELLQRLDKTVLVN